MEQSARPAPYGRACANCARAKCKCLLRSDGASCERCFRLNKQCTPSPTVRKKRQRTTASQTARLEEKLDGLVSLLKSNGRSNPYYDNTTANLPCGWEAGNANSSGNVAAASNIRTADASTSSSTLGDSTSKATPPTFTPLTPASASSSLFPCPLPHDAEVSAQEAETYLRIFRTRHLSNFPFYYLPDTQSSAELRQEKPFLWLCIMSVSSTNLEQQLSLARVVREMASKVVIMEGERSLDILLGLLCICGWGHYQVQLGPMLTVFAHLCIALISDLELQRMPQIDTSKHPRCPPPNVHYKFQIPGTRTLEHRRTILAVYLLTSSLATCHQRLDYLMWSPYLEDCLKKIDEANEAPYDKLLVNLVKIHRVTDQSVQTYSRIRDTDTEESTRYLGQYIVSMRQQLQLVQEKIPPHLASNRSILFSLHYSSLAIHELILLRLQHVSLAQENDNFTVQSLIECATAVKGLLESFIENFEPMDYLGMPFTIWKQTSSSMFLVARLVGLEDPGWDVSIIKDIVYLPDVIEGFASEIEKLIAMVGWKTDGPENVYIRSIRMLQMTKNWARSFYTSVGQAAAPSSSSMDENSASRQNPATLAAVWQEEERSRWQQQHQQQQQQQQVHTQESAAMVAEDAAITTQMADVPMLPIFDQEIWSDDMFGLWNLYSSGRGAFGFTE